MHLPQSVCLMCRGREAEISFKTWSSFAYLRLVLRNKVGRVELPDDMFLLFEFVTGTLETSLTALGSSTQRYDDCLALREQALTLGLDPTCVLAGKLCSLLYTMAANYSWSIQAWETLCVHRNRDFATSWPILTASEGLQVCTHRHTHLRELYVRSVLPFHGPTVDLRCAESLGDSEEAVRMRSYRGLDELLRKLDL